MNNLSVPFFFLFLSFTTVAFPYSYTPGDHIVLNCGSSADSTALDGRRWNGDTASSQFAPVEQPDKQSTATKPLGQGNSMVSVIPFTTARISNSEFTYLIPVAAGQKFIRLYFYPTFYPGFDSYKALFSVRVGPYTLFRNFNASLYAESLQVECFVKEFVVKVDNAQKLNISFIPSPSSSSNLHHAFINGVEVLSMPTDLYKTGLPFVSQNYDVLETVHRLNIGGRSIPPMNDTGVFRSWSNDSNYFHGGGISSLNSNIQLDYSKIPQYTAPDEVYRTALSSNKMNNLTWGLPVDFGFKYLLRLHFCELDPLATKVGDRKFSISIDNRTAEVFGDVIEWSGGNGIPVYKDYVVKAANKGVQSRQMLFISLHSRENVNSYSAALLNGMEVLKIRYAKLDGDRFKPDPEPSATTKPKVKQKPFKAIAGAAVSGATVFFLLGFTIFCQWRRGKSREVKPLSLLCRHFSLAQIQIATNNFDRAQVIGHGGFGLVFKGYIDGLDTPVAIKKLNQSSVQGARQFLAEIEILSGLQHPNLVSLIGYCNEEHHMILVYDYMKNGTIRDHLYKTNNPPLPWKQRLQICIGAARGLEYLHAGAERRIIHRDVKTTNILLNEEWAAKVSDFGLSKLGPTTMSRSHISTDVKGTFGYLDPEYFLSRRLTAKSDVYGFGVVLFEALCGRAPVEMELEEEKHSLSIWARRCVEERRTVDGFVDPCLMGEISSECLKVFVEIAYRCLKERRSDRPTMTDVVGSLELAMELQEKDDGDEIDKIDGNISLVGRDNQSGSCGREDRET